MTAPTYFTATQSNIVITDESGATITANGNVLFQPNLSEIVAPDDVVILLSPTQGTFDASGVLCADDGGGVGVSLIDNVGLGLAPGALSYTVSYESPQVPIASFEFEAPGTGETLDLSTVMPS